MEYTEFPPHPLLAPFIECYWAALSDRPPFREKESLVPDGTIELMFNFGDDYARFRGADKVPVRGSHVIGIRKQALWISQTMHQNVFSVRFKLGGAYPFFRIPTQLTANDFFGIGELLDPEYRELEARLCDAADNRERVLLANRFFLSRLSSVPGEALQAGRYTEALFRHAPGSIRELCRLFNTNYKSIERRFSRLTGFSPSELLRIRRFNNAILAMYSCRYPSLTQVAYACGYYDQAHFIREFRALSGQAPGAFLKQQYTIVQVIQPALAERLSNSYNL